MSNGNSRISNSEERQEENYTKPSMVKEHAAIKTLELDNKTTLTLQYGKDNKFGIRK